MRSDGIDYQLHELDAFHKLERGDALVEATTYDGHCMASRKRMSSTCRVLSSHPSGANALIDHFESECVHCPCGNLETVRKARMNAQGDDQMDIMMVGKRPRSLHQGQSERINLVVTSRDRSDR